MPKPQENFVEKKNINNLNCCEQNEFHNSAVPKAQHGFLNNTVVNLLSILILLNSAMQAIWKLAKIVHSQI